uniref:RING-type domain-containing protein n=1 Tax=Neolamprologus brichardi TaxID=32507 RepID=A0A3Q4M3J2_NEOBR
MASGWTEEESFACPVCLETLKDPATLPCGHSYCLACIQSHWDKGGSKGQYSCPQCRQVFNPRPSLAKSTLLAEAMEKLRTNSLKQHSFTAPSPGPPSMPVYLEVQPDTMQRKGSVYPQLPSVEPKPCHQHAVWATMSCLGVCTGLGADFPFGTITRKNCWVHQRPNGSASTWTSM